MWLWFLHWAGIIVALGATTVIETLGLLASRSVEWTQVTVRAHHVTKALIWLGLLLILATWPFLARPWGLAAQAKSLLLLILLLNGCFLSCWVSPRVEAYRGRRRLFRPGLRRATIASMLVSFLAWWSLVALTVAQCI